MIQPKSLRCLRSVKYFSQIISWDCLNYIYKGMKFFQFQQEKVIDFKWVHIHRIHQMTLADNTKNTKKPYERYKDMRLAIKLLEKGENPVFKLSQQKTDDLNTKENSLVLHERTTKHLQFTPHRLKVIFPKKKGLQYKNYLMRSTSVDHFRLV